MQSVDLSDLEKLSGRLNDLMKEMPEMRRELHERLAEEAKEEVDAQIASGVHDDNGMISAWQEPHVGSGGGYAAVRATNISSGPNGPGAITNYLESGHRIRQPSGQAKRYKPKIRVPYVDGRHFYQSARAAMQSRAIAAAEELADKIAERLNSG